jgi:hypothetical protein
MNGGCCPACRSDVLTSECHHSCHEPGRPDAGSIPLDDPADPIPARRAMAQPKKETLT